MSQACLLGQYVYIPGLKTPWDFVSHAIFSNLSANTLFSVHGYYYVISFLCFIPIDNRFILKEIWGPTFIYI